MSLEWCFFEIAISWSYNEVVPPNKPTRFHWHHLDAIEGSSGQVQRIIEHCPAPLLMGLIWSTIKKKTEFQSSQSNSGNSFGRFGTFWCMEGATWVCALPSKNVSKKLKGRPTPLPAGPKGPRRYHRLSGISKHLVNKHGWKISVAFFEEEDIYRKMIIALSSHINAHSVKKHINYVSI